MFNRPSRAKKTVREGISRFITMATMLEQFKQIKEQYPDALLLFRCGDFYEMYHEDADKASKVLNITVTHRGDGVHMCGFPFHALDGYLPKLVRAGFRVAICDQLEPTKHKVTEIVNEVPAEPKQPLYDKVKMHTDWWYTIKKAFPEAKPCVEAFEALLDFAFERKMPTNSEYLKVIQHCFQNICIVIPKFC